MKRAVKDIKRNLYIVTPERRVSGIGGEPEYRANGYYYYLKKLRLDEPYGFVVYFMTIGYESAVLDFRYVQ